MKTRYPVVTDALERVLATFVAALLGLATADGLDWTDWGSLDNWKAWAAAALTSAFTLVKTLIAMQVAKRNGQATSASLAPQVQLQPTGDPVL